MGFNGGLVQNRDGDAATVNTIGVASLNDTFAKITSSGGGGFDCRFDGNDQVGAMAEPRGGFVAT